MKKLVVNSSMVYFVNNLAGLLVIRSIIARRYMVTPCDVSCLVIDTDYEANEKYFQFKVRGFTCGMIMNYATMTVWTTPITRAMAYSNYLAWFVSYYDDKSARMGIQAFKSQI